MELRLGHPEAALPILERATEYFREHGRIGNLVSNLLRVSEALVLVGRSDDAELPLTEAALWAGRLGLVRDLAEVVRIRELVPVDEQSIC